MSGIDISDSSPLKELALVRQGRWELKNVAL